MIEGTSKVVARVYSAPIGGSLLNQEMKEGVVGRRNRSSQTRLRWVPRLLIEKEKGLLKQVFRESHSSHPARVFEMGEVGSEIKIGLKSPSIEGLEFIKEGSRYSSSDVGKPGSMNGVGGKQDTEKYRGFSIRIRPERESDIADFTGIEQLGRLRDRFSELRLVYESGRDVHNAIISRPSVWV
jgi:hypothetical protein